MNFLILIIIFIYSSNGRLHFERRDDSSQFVIVNTTNGEVRGIHENNFYRFLGIPFGVWRSLRGLNFQQPPIGDMRWRAPLPSLSWAPQIFNATEFG